MSLISLFLLWPFILHLVTLPFLLCFYSTSYHISPTLTHDLFQVFFFLHLLGCSICLFFIASTWLPSSHPFFPLFTSSLFSILVVQVSVPYKIPCDHFSLFPWCICRMFMYSCFALFIVLTFGSISLQTATVFCYSFTPSFCHVLSMVALFSVLTSPVSAFICLSFLSYYSFDEMCSSGILLFWSFCMVFSSFLMFTFSFHPLLSLLFGPCTCLLPFLYYCCYFPTLPVCPNFFAILFPALLPVKMYGCEFMKMYLGKCHVVENKCSKQI